MESKYFYVLEYESKIRNIFFIILAKQQKKNYFADKN